MTNLRPKLECEHCGDDQVLDLQLVRQKSGIIRQMCRDCIDYVYGPEDEDEQVEAWMTRQD